MSREVEKCERYELFTEKLLFIVLCFFSFSLFLPQPRYTLLASISLGLLIIWRSFFQHKSTRSIPLPVIIFSFLFLISLLVSVLLSNNQASAEYQIKEYRFFLIGGLLYATVIKDRHRKFIITAFVISAAISGAVGIFQHFNIIPLNGIDGRPHGFDVLSIHYASKLSLAFGALIILLFFFKKSYKEESALLITLALVLIIGGILFSLSRTAWLATAVPAMITLLLFSRKKFSIFVLVLITTCIATFSLSSSLRSRAVSIVTSVSSFDKNSSTGERINLWKASFLIFKESPIIGIGIGDYSNTVKRLIREKNLSEIRTTVHAHNIFLQTLATQGLLGLLILLCLFFVLIRWGISEAYAHGRIGGYIIVVATLTVVIGGLTENNLGIPKFLPIYTFLIGLIGPYPQDKAVHPDSD